MRCKPFGPGLRLAFQPVMLGARFRVSRPLAIDVVAQGGDFLRQPFQYRNGLEFGLRRFKAAAHFVKRLRDAADAFIQRAGLGQALGNLPLMLGQRLP